MEYAIQYPNWEYVVDPTESSIDGICDAIDNHPWADGISMFESLGNTDKMHPTLDAGDDTRDTCFFCAALAKNRFEVSISLPISLPQSIIGSFFKRPFQRGRSIELGECSSDQAKELLILWAETKDSDIEAVMRQKLKQMKSAEAT